MTYDLKDVTDANILVQARLIGLLLERGILSEDDVKTVLNRAIEDAAERPNAGPITGIIHAMVGSKGPSA